ncbi:hypothetical protein ACFO3J_26750 [Streptomyces polygonati]|uniref:Uncharacterized protein n=1 Tax=Streptomyces polygonati TaxID=1617087 RepID=A0ABV8HSP6_9ACTN
MLLVNIKAGPGRWILGLDPQELTYITAKLRAQADRLHDEIRPAVVAACRDWGCPPPGLTPPSHSSPGPLQGEPETNLRGRPFHSFWLARAQLQRGQVEPACVNQSATVDSPRVTAHWQEFRHLLTPFRSSRPVAELDARLLQAAG